MQVPHNKAGFRALRELVGLSQPDIADHFGVQTRSVRRWEHPGTPWGAPDDVWEWLESVAEMQVELVTTAIAAAEGKEAVQLTYWRSQAQYDALGREPGPYTVANANARLVAWMLSSLGVEVSFVYPDDPDNIYHQG